jgi:tetratricopeptide (TPR) repeat protein
MERIMTKTMGEIYLHQGHLQEAYEIFEYLAQKDPQDMEVQKRLKELRDKLYPPTVTLPYPPAKDETIHHLEKWLENIQKRRKN